MKNASRFLLCGVCCVLFSSAPVSAASVADVVGRVSRVQYQHYLDDMLYARTGNDRAYGPEHDMAMTNIFDQFTAFGLQTTLEPFTYSGKTYYNVVGILPGQGSRSNEVYLLNAHYDSARDGEGNGVPGADDDGSGVAGLLEAARVLAQFPLDATLVFAAFDREEDDTVGSTEYVTAHGSEKFKGVVALDMIACNSSTNRPEICCLDMSKPLMLSLSNAIALYGQGLEVSYGGPETNADHFSFESKGFQACLLFEAGKNPWYHSLSDCIETPGYIDYDFATKMTRSAVGWIATAAGIYSAPPVQILRLPPDRVKLVWPDSGTNVTAQVSTNLAAGSWTDIPSGEVGKEGTNSVLIQSSTADRRFYRLIER
jgi:hypothetical protein